MKSIIKMLRNEKGSLASTWIVVLVCLFVLMLTYTIFYPIIVTAFYQLVVFYGGDVNAANKVRIFFVVFPVFFMFSILAWGFMSSFRREQDNFRVR